MKDRATHVTATRDFNRPYRDIVDKRGPWTMEEWIHWTEAWSPYILADHACAQTGRILHDPRLRQMWSLLREATLHYVRATPGNGIPEQQQAAHEKLQQYAKLVSQHFGIKACTYNLHLLVCRYVLCLTGINILLSRQFLLIFSVACLQAYSKGQAMCNPCSDCMQSV